MESIPFIAWCLENLNYWVIIFLMTIESSFIPFPSEVIVPPAAYMAATTGNQNIYLIILSASIGACIGALLNYYIALFLGRPIIYRFANSRIGHMCLIDQAKVEQAEQYFDKHGAIGTLVGRLIPVIRQLISLPAGLARMNIGRFIIYTSLGATIWNVILAAMGWYIGRNFSGQLEEKVAEYSGELKIVMLALGFCIFIFFAYKGLRK